MIRFLLPACLFMASLATAQNSGLPIICGNEALDYIVQRQYPELQQTFQTSFEENLADSIILSQMAVLNEDYNRENADTSRLRAAFKPVAGNPQIHFDLVEIKRIQTSATFKLDLLGSEILANLKSGAQGGSDAEDPNAFLNIWICKIQPIQFGGITIGQILGFAFPPNNLGH